MRTGNFLVVASQIFQRGDDENDHGVITQVFEFDVDDRPGLAACVADHKAAHREVQVFVCRNEEWCPVQYSLDVVPTITFL